MMKYSFKKINKLTLFNQNHLLHILIQINKTNPTLINKIKVNNFIKQKNKFKILTNI